jgi:peptidoglycan biosynthesis protein MviN/MurJ (putative lipid II flippase)
MFVSLGSIGINAALSYWFIFRLGYGHGSLAFTTGVVAIVNFAVLYLVMRHYTGRLETRHLLASSGKILVAGAALAGVCIAARMRLLTGDWFTSGTIWKLSTLLPVIAVAGGVFFALAQVLRIPEIRQFTELVKRKFGRA